VNQKVKQIVYMCNRLKHAQDKFRNLEYFSKMVDEAGLYENERTEAIRLIKEILEVE
jgi:hypothetical protein